VKKWIKYIAAAFFSLLLLLFTGGYYLLGTRGGTDFLVSLAQKQLNGSLQIGSASGKILDRLELTDVVFANPAGRAEVSHLLLDWKSTDLLRLHLHILELSTDDGSYTVLSANPEPEPETDDTGPLTLPDLKLPLSITVEQLSVNNLVFTSAPESDPLKIEHAGLALLWNQDGIQLQDLQISMPQGFLQGQGEVMPTGDYPLQLSTVLETRDPQLPGLKLSGKYSGDLQKLIVEQQISGDISASLHLTLEQLLTDPAWQGSLDIQELAPAVFSPGAPGTLKGTVNTSGNLQQAMITASLSIRDNEVPEVNWDGEFDLQADLKTLQLNIKQLSLTHASLPTRIDLSGTASEKQLNLALDWQQLQWPMENQAGYNSVKGAIRLTGTVDDYHLGMDADVAGSDIPAGTIRLNTDGNTNSVDNLQLSADLLEGEVNIQGNVQWSPAVTWQLSTDGTNINPGAQYEEWPGRLQWLIKTRGSMEDEGMIADVTLERIEGELRDLPIAGSGQVHLQPEHIVIDDLLLSSGKALLSATGELSSDSSLKWKIDVPDLADLLPEAGGSLLADGTLLGEMNSPQAGMTLTASSLSYQETNLQQLEAEAAVDLSWAEPFSLKLSGINLQAGENLIKKLELDANGSIEEHTAQLTVSHELANLKMVLQGGYLEDQEQWQGMLDKLDIAAEDLGTWRLAGPTEINAGAKAAAIAPLCLKQQDASICLDGSWDADNVDTGGHLAISDFSLDYLSPWYPEALTRLSGVFSLKAAASMKEELQADVKAEITPGSIDYRTLMNKGTLPHQGVKLNLHVADNGVDGNLFLSVDSNIIKAEINSPDLLESGVGGKAGITGTLLIEAARLDLVKALVPDIEELDLAVNTQFKIQGTLDQPRVNGGGKLHIANLLVPTVGLELNNTDFNISAADKKIQINGTLNSPEGSLAIDGGATLDSAQNWPARFTIKGNNFRLINLPEIQIFLTSDLLLEKKKDLTRLTGTVTIPRADILLRELPAGSETVSPDVVIIQDADKEEDTSPVEMDLKVILGRNVHFAGLGVNAFIEGQLSITAEPEEQMMGSGEFHIKEGSYRAYGQDLEIVTGVISFPGGPLTQPGINLQAIRELESVTVGIYAIGPAAKPRITTMSEPPMSESNVISYLLTGSAPNDTSSGAKVSIGRQINNKLSVSVGADVKTGEREFITRYRLNRKIHVQATTATNSNAADIFYTVEFGQKGKKKKEPPSEEK
jgi:translocation and assembly module TamB